MEPHLVGHRVGVWCAVSSKPQATEDKSSLPDQELAGRRFAEALGGRVVAVYTVPGHTRDYVFWHEAESEMPAYRLVREDLQAGHLDVIHAVDTDRLGRDPALVNQFLSLATRHNCEVYLASAPHPVGQQSVGHRYLYAIQAVRAGEDQAMRRYRMANGMKGRISRGMIASIPPLGYRAVRDAFGRTIGYELDEHADTIRFLTRLFLDGFNATEICRRLNAAGRWHPNRPGRPWTLTTLRQILANDVYAGFSHWGAARPDQPSPRFPALWDPETYAAILAERKRRRRNYTRHGAGPLTGVAYCGRCGERMTRVPRSNGWTLRCSGHARYKPDDGPRPCHNNAIPEQAAIAYLGDFLRAHVTDEDLEHELLARTDPHAAEAAQAQHDRTRAAVRNCEQQRARLALALAAGQLDAQMYRSTDDAILTQLESLTTELQHLDKENAALPDLQAKLAALVAITEDFGNLIATREPAAVAATLQRAGIRIYIEDHICRSVQFY